MSNEYRSQAQMGARVDYPTQAKLEKASKINRKRMGGDVPPVQPPSISKAKKRGGK